MKMQALKEQVHVKKIIISRQPNVRSSATICQTALESNLSK